MVVTHPSVVAEKRIINIGKSLFVAVVLIILPLAPRKNLGACAYGVKAMKFRIAVCFVVLSADESV